jgi:hypothetical protein
MDPTLALQATEPTTPVEVVGAAARRHQPAQMAPHVAETMRRVHAQLRSGRAPSYESLMAFGAPVSR